MFEVKVHEVGRGHTVLSVTYNGTSWSSVRVKSEEEARAMVVALLNYFGIGCLEE